MTLMGQTLILYLLVGVGVAGAVYLSAGAVGGWERWFRVATALPFWPFYVPLLLAGKRTRLQGPETAGEEPGDEMTSAIVQVDAELQTALSALDGWAEEVLARQRDRLRGLRAAWTARAGRIREMDRLLNLPEKGTSASDQEHFSAIPLHLSPAANERLRHSQQVRRQNLERLRSVRQRAYDDLMATLAWVRELASMIQLARFMGAPAARVGELVAQAASTADGLPEISWQDETYLPTAENS